jgi:hypothetical protein
MNTAKSGIHLPSQVRNPLLADGDQLITSSIHTLHPFLQAEQTTELMKSSDVSKEYIASIFRVEK